MPHFSDILHVFRIKRKTNLQSHDLKISGKKKTSNFKSEGNFSHTGKLLMTCTGADLGGRGKGCSPLPEMTYGFLLNWYSAKKCGLFVLVTPFLSGAPPLKKFQIFA